MTIQDIINAYFKRIGTLTVSERIEFFSGFESQRAGAVMYKASKAFRAGFYFAKNPEKNAPVMTILGQTGIF